MSLILTSCLLFSAASICLSPSRFILFLSFPSFPQRTTHPIHGDQYAAHKHKSVQVHARTHSHTAHIRSCEESPLLVCGYVRYFYFAEGRKWVPLKGLMCNCCTVLPCWDITPLLAFVFTVIYYVLDILSVWNVIFWLFDSARQGLKAYEIWRWNESKSSVDVLVYK